MKFKITKKELLHEAITFDCGCHCIDGLIGYINAQGYILTNTGFKCDVYRIPNNLNIYATVGPCPCGMKADRQILKYFDNVALAVRENNKFLKSREASMKYLFNCLLSYLHSDYLEKYYPEDKEYYQNQKNKIIESVEKINALAKE